MQVWNELFELAQFCVVNGCLGLIPLQEGNASSSTHPFTTAAGHCGHAGDSVVLLVPAGHPPAPKAGDSWDTLWAPSDSKVLPDPFRMSQAEHPLTGCSACFQPNAWHLLFCLGRGDSVRPPIGSLMVLLPCGTALVCLQGKAQQKRNARPGEKCEQGKQFPSYRWCFQHLVPSGDAFCLAQWTALCLSRRKALTCALHVPQSLQEL